MPKSPDRAAETGQAAQALGVSAIVIRPTAPTGKVRGAVAQTVAHFGRLDILVVNAGILIRGTVDTFSVEDFDRMLATNVRGVLRRDPRRPHLISRTVGELSPSAAIQPSGPHFPAAASIR